MMIATTHTSARMPAIIRIIDVLSAPPGSVAAWASKGISVLIAPPIEVIEDLSRS